MNRDELESCGVFGKEIAALEPDIVIDLICYTKESCQDLVTALHGRIQVS